MKQVYLAGPITGLPYTNCTFWRDYAKAKLFDVGIKTYSPMRAKEYLSKLPAISGTGEEYAHLGPFSTPKAIMSRDFFDCAKADVVLVNFFFAKAVSIGTVAEMAWAYANRTPIVVVMEESGNPHEHLFIREMAGFRAGTLDDGLDIVKAILL